MRSKKGVFGFAVDIYIFIAFILITVVFLVLFLLAKNSVALSIQDIGEIGDCKQYVFDHSDKTHDIAFQSNIILLSFLRQNMKQYEGPDISVQEYLTNVDTKGKGPWKGSYDLGKVYDAAKLFSYRFAKGIYTVTEPISGEKKIGNTDMSLYHDGCVHAPCALWRVFVQQHASGCYRDSVVDIMTVPTIDGGSIAVCLEKVDTVCARDYQEKQR